MQPSGDRPVVISFRPEHLVGWTVTISLCLVPVYFWLHLHPLAGIHTFPAKMLSLGQLTGLIGMVMYALNLVYATRLRFLERWFGGLNRVYIAHHLLGGFALMFLSMHPLFLALRYVKSSLLQAALLLIPSGLTPLSALYHPHDNLHQLILSQWAIFFGIIAFWGMVGLLLITFFIKIPYHFWLFTHRFLGWAFFLAGLHVLFVTSDTSINGPLKYYMLSTAGVGLVAFTYRRFMGNILIRRYRYNVHSVAQDAAGVTQLVMYPKDARKRMSYKSGQFVFVRFLNTNIRSGVTKEWHPFSISSSPRDEYLRLSIKALGDYTNVMGQLKEGSEAEIEGAYGRFTYTNIRNHNQIWIAGGIGVTPFISMARDLPSGGFNIDFYYSVKTASELIDWKSLQEIASDKRDNFRIIPFIAEQQNGHLTADFVVKYSGSLEHKDIFVCGPPVMMKSMRQQFKHKGVPGARIHTEEFAMS